MNKKIETHPTFCCAALCPVGGLTMSWHCQCSKTVLWLNIYADTPVFKCVKVRSRDTSGKTYFPYARERAIVQRLNRTNNPLFVRKIPQLDCRAHQFEQGINNFRRCRLFHCIGNTQWQKADFSGTSPQIKPLVLTTPAGNWSIGGPVSGGKGYCPDLGGVHVTHLLGSFFYFSQTRTRMYFV